MYYNLWKRESSHIEYITEVLVNTNVVNQYIENNQHIQDIASIDTNRKENVGKLIDSIIIKYIAKVVYEYTVNNNGWEFDALGYFNTVFRVNCDLWGFIVCYESFAQLSGKMFPEDENRAENVRSVIGDIVLKYLISTPTTAINLNKLKRSLSGLENTIWQ